MARACRSRGSDQLALGQGQRFARIHDIAFMLGKARPRPGQLLAAGVEPLQVADHAERPVASRRASARSPRSVACGRVGQAGRDPRLPSESTMKAAKPAKPKQADGQPADPVLPGHQILDHVGEPDAGREADQPAKRRGIGACPNERRARGASDRKGPAAGIGGCVRRDDGRVRRCAEVSIVTFGSSGPEDFRTAVRSCARSSCQAGPRAESSAPGPDGCGGAPAPDPHCIGARCAAGGTGRN